MMQSWGLDLNLENKNHPEAPPLSVTGSRSSTTMAFDGNYIRHLTDCQTLLSIRYIE